MSLRRYASKRDFTVTPEPKGKGAAAHARPIFVVQKHDATRLHYDFRLEVGGALASWAVPKGPSLDPDDKRLAVHVEDHPIDYATFEGVIPKGQYGAGPVIVWDRGVWTPDDDNPARAIKRGKLSFTLEGEKLRGGWTLTRIRSAKDDDKDNWLLIKRDDEHAAHGDDPIVDRLPQSVQSGVAIEDLAPRNGHAPKTPPAPAPKEPVDPVSLPNAKKGRLPAAIAPQLCTLVSAAPRGEGWLHEIKFDGYRALLRKDKSGVRVITRNGHDWTHKFRPLADECARLPAGTLAVDGEICMLDERGRSSFQQLQNAIKAQRFEGRLVFFAFDLVHLDGYDLSRTPLVERKRALGALLRSAEGLEIVRYSQHFDGSGGEVQRSACDLGLEGVVSKRADAPYTEGRSKTWVKSKCSKRQEFVIVGWTPPGGSRKHFGSLLLGVHDEGGALRYSGKVGTGFTAVSLADVGRRLKALARDDSPLDVPAPRSETRGARWVEPRLVAEVEYTEVTSDGRLRHPSFQGLREDKEAEQVVIEKPAPAPTADAAKRPTTRAKSAKKSPSRRGRGSDTPGSAGEDRVVVGGVAISNPGRVLYPEQGQTKLDLARYYESMAERILPHIEGRPLSTVRCPQGRAKQCFFQKHIRESFGDAVRPIEVMEKDGKAEYISVESPEGLLSLVQFGVLEIHPWGARGANLDKPDTLTFDLDPGEGATLDQVKEAALRVRDVLGALDLETFLKASGGKGLHVVLPLRPYAGWDDAKEFCERIAKMIAAEEPEKYLAKMSKAARKGKVFIDWLRNSRGATSIAPFSTRARAGAPVAMPLRWADLRTLESPSQFTIGNSPARMKRLKKDPWEGYFGVKQRLTAAHLKAARQA